MFMTPMQTILLFAALVALSLKSIFIGVSSISPWDIVNLTPLQDQIIYISRLPRLISILLAGSSLAVAGTIMHQLTRHKFDSPTTAGTIDSARLGILVSLIVFHSASMLQKTMIAILFALAGTFIFMEILKRIRYKDTIFVPLVGLMFGNIVGAITTFIAYKYDLIQSLTVWLHGDFSMILSERYETLYVSAPLLLIAGLYATRFTIAGLGNDFSANLALNHQRIVSIGLSIVASISAIVVLTVGSLPFLGFIIPNIVAIYRGDNLRSNLVHTALLGAVFVLACDILARVVIFPYEVSVCHIGIAHV